MVSLDTTTSDASQRNILITSDDSSVNENDSICLFRCLLPRRRRRATRRNEEESSEEDENSNPVVPQDASRQEAGRQGTLWRRRRDGTSRIAMRSSESYTAREQRRRENIIKQQQEDRQAEVDAHLVVKMVHIFGNDAQSFLTSIEKKPDIVPIKTNLASSSTTLKNPLSSSKILDSNIIKNATNAVSSIGQASEKIIYLRPSTDVATAVVSSSYKSQFLQDTNCPICWEPYEQGDLVSSSPNPQCCHSFHKKCITTWLLKPNHDDCPMCRSDYLNLPKRSIRKRRH